MKKIGSLLLAICLLFLLSGEAFAVSSENDTEVTKVTEAYLKECAFSQYFYEQRPIEQYTIKAVAEDQKDALSQIAAKYRSFRDMQKDVPYAETSLNTGDLSVLEANLTLQNERISYYGHLNELEGITYSYFTPSYDVVECNVDDDLATVNVYESLDFQYSNCDEPSFVLTHYYISLFKVNDVWLIAAVESDDLFYQEYHESGFDLKKEISGVDEAKRINLDESSNALAAEEPSVSVRALAATDKPYYAQNAVNYALTYSTSTDTGSVPSYKNDFFYWDSNSCQLFASQCIWAGFAGSNTQTDVNNKQAMDASGSYQWWSTKTAYNRSDTSWNSWLYVPQFRVYVNGVKGSLTETGVVCDTHDVAYNSDAMGFTASELKGAVLHVKGSSEALGHAVVVNNATGTTRGSVYITYYNNCHKNVLLSTYFPSSTSDTKNNIFVMVPTCFRGGDTSYLYGDLQNALVMGSGVTVTLYGRATSPLSLLSLSVYAPGASTASATYSAYNASTVSGSFTFNQVGTWRVVVSGTGLSTYTYTVRVV